MLIRPATLADIAELQELAREYAAQMYPQLKYDSSRAGSQFRAAISSARHFLEVVEKDGKLLGALGALVGDNLWARKSHCNVVIWVSKAPGQGAALLRRFRRWVDSRPVVRVSGFALDAPVDVRVRHLLERAGFGLQGGAHNGTYLRYR